MDLIYSSKCNNIALSLRNKGTGCWGTMMFEGRSRSELPFD